MKKKSDDGEALYCTCRKKFTPERHMIRCELCFEWFHSTCVPLPKLPSKEAAALEDDKLSAQVLVVHRIMSRQMRFLCTACARSRRPKLDTILSLLLALQRLSVRIIEADILNCITTKITEWLDRARGLLDKYEIKVALDEINQSDAFCPDANDPCSAIDGSPESSFASSPPIDKIKSDYVEDSVPSDMNMDCEETTGGKELSQTTSQDELAVAGILMSWKDENKDCNSSSMMARPIVKKKEDFGHKGEQDKALASDHAYATSVNTNHSNSLDESKKEVYTVGFSPRVKLAPELLSQLEELLIEADLFEVSMVETGIIWRLLEANKYRSKDIPDIGVSPLNIFRELNGVSWLLFFTYIYFSSLIIAMES